MKHYLSYIHQQPQYPAVPFLKGRQQLGRKNQNSNARIQIRVRILREETVQQPSPAACNDNDTDNKQILPVLMKHLSFHPENLIHLKIEKSEGNKDYMIHYLNKLFLEKYKQIFETEEKEKYFYECFLLNYKEFYKNRRVFFFF